MKFLLYLIELTILIGLLMYFKYILPIAGGLIFLIIGLGVLLVLYGIYIYGNQKHRLVGATFVLLLWLVADTLQIFSNPGLLFGFGYSLLLVAGLAGYRSRDWLRIDFEDANDVQIHLAVLILSGLLVAIGGMGWAAVSGGLEVIYWGWLLALPILVVIEELFWREYLLGEMTEEEEQAQYWIRVVWGTVAAGLVAMPGGLGLALGVIGKQLMLYGFFRSWGSLSINVLLNVLFSYGIWFVVGFRLGVLGF